ncbi:uncharacterized protein LOC141714914 [Apium graveolens]|uniref:uncharacterized protein LOC141714914 n=1 Tax=Apium graveolens TaxID=4045 RepID=UPI003D7A2ECA
MGIFLIPQQTCKELEGIMSKFWWRTSKQNERASLAFSKKSDSLVSRLYKARYFPNSSFLEATLGNNPSYTRRSILEAQVLLKKGAVRRIGSGETVSIENDPWLPHKEDPYIHTSHEALKDMKVNSLMVTGEREWNQDLIKDIFNGRDANLILSIPLSNSDADSWFWNNEKLGLYTVAKACWVYAGYVFNFQPCTNFFDWFRMAVGVYKIEDLNAIVWNKKGEEFVQIVESARHIFNQWRYAQDKSFNISLGFMTQADGNERWTKPNVGELKINVDATCFTDSNKYSFAFLVRDSQGNVVEAQTKCKQGQVDSEIAEAMGIREALSWVKEKNVGNVVVESDCLVAIQRSANKVAHELVRHSSSIADRNWSGGDVHQLFSSVLYDDLKV